jgi:hypothetical protein
MDRPIPLGHLSISGCISVCDGKQEKLFNIKMLDMGENLQKNNTQGILTVMTKQMQLWHVLCRAA